MLVWEGFLIRTRPGRGFSLMPRQVGWAFGSCSSPGSQGRKLWHRLAVRKITSSSEVWAASETVNYTVESLKAWARREGPVDVVIDSLGGKTLEDAWFCVRYGGASVSIFEPPEGKRPRGLKDKVLKNGFFIMTPNCRQLAEISRLLDDGHCKAVVDSVWDFEDYKGAFKRLDGDHANGKAVIKVNE